MNEKRPPHHVRLAADICVYRQAGDEIQFLLIRRAKPPFEGCWALPGGRLEADETLDQCASRELLEETGLRAVELRHLANFSEPMRDPRERTVSAAYIARVADDAKAVAATDAVAVEWFLTSSLPELAFDHHLILRKALDFLRGHLGLPASEQLINTPGGAGE